MSINNPPIPDAATEPPAGAGDNPVTAPATEQPAAQPITRRAAALARELPHSTPHVDDAHGQPTTPVAPSTDDGDGPPVERPAASAAAVRIDRTVTPDAESPAAPAGSPSGTADAESGEADRITATVERGADELAGRPTSTTSETDHVPRSRHGSLDEPVDESATATAMKQSAARTNSLGALAALAMRLHFYAGMFVGPFILIAALTGALYSLAPTIESVVNHGLLHVDSSGPARPLADQVATAVAMEPKLALAAVDPAQHPGDSTRVLFTDPSLGESEQRAVFVDPVTAKSVGVSVVYGSTGALPLRTWIDQLHRNLHLGEPGRLYSETAASWLWVVALAGLVVWLRRAGSRSRGLRRLVWPDRSRKGRSRTMNWHGAVGMWVLLPALFLSATGMTWSTYAGAHVDALRAQLSWTTPSVSSALPGSGTRPDGSSNMPGMSMPGMSMPGMDMHSGTPGGTDQPSNGRIAQVDKVFAVARGRGLDGAVEITVPTTDHTAFVVKERRISGSLAQDAIAVDGVTGDVTGTVRYADWPLMAKLANWGIALHMGMMFGLANQLLLLLTMIALITVIVRGYLMWWRRRPLRASRFALGAPPRRGALRGVHPAVLAGAAVIAAAVCWFAPMLGIPLLGFLIIDIAIGLVQRRRATP